MKQVRVRMYRQGLGDCFLLSFTGDAGTAHMLVDCGVLKGTVDGDARMRAAVANVVQETGGRVDVLVVTHEHWDHVSGFIQAGAEFAQLRFGEVWLAWTEDSTNELATTLREKRTKARQALEAARQQLRLSAAPAAAASLKVLDALNLFDGGFGAAGTRTTAGAMKWAREGTSARVRYLSPGDEPLVLAGADGVRVFVLGPPTDVTLLKKSDPSTRTPEVYELMSAADAGFAAALDGPGEEHAGCPFDESFEIPVEQAKGDPFYQERYFAAGDWRRIEDDWLGAAERLALQLDADTNNTSLVLAIDIGPGVLLFPGDAQVGNWLSWDAVHWSLPGAGGQRTEVTAQDLLERTVLYKVGHHASHNATLREKGLEQMKSRDLVALIPVDRKKAVELEWEMPFGPLLERLRQKTLGRVLTADEGLPPDRPADVSESTWQEFQRRVSVTDGWIDYTIDV